MSKTSQITLAVCAAVIGITVLTSPFTPNTHTIQNVKHTVEGLKPTPAQTTPPVLIRFNKQANSIDDPTSIWTIINKQRPVPAEYEPTDLTPLTLTPSLNGQPLRAAAANAFDAMYAAAQLEGITLQLTSGYRSYNMQTNTYQQYVNQLGEEAANLTSAKPGHSEHQTGLAADITSPEGCTVQTCFANTAAGIWTATHAWEYGYILRYPEGYTHITGYEYEPWHYRYVGTELAKDFHTSGLATLEEYFNLPAAPTYLQ